MSTQHSIPILLLLALVLSAFANDVSLYDVFFPAAHDGGPRHENDATYLGLSQLTGHQSACHGRNDCHYGRYRRPFKDVSLQPTWFESIFKHKRWFYTSVTTSQQFFAFALVNLGYASNVFAYTVDYESGEYHEFTTLTPLSRGVDVAHSSVNPGCSSYRALWGGSKIDFCFNSETKTYTIEVDLWATRSVPADPSSNDALFSRLQSEGGTTKNYGHIRSSISIRHSDVHESLAVLFPLGYDHDTATLSHAPGYTHKVCALPATISLSTHGGQRVSSQTGLANIDYTSSLARRITVWKWTSLAATSRHGHHTVGLNIATSVYESPEGASQENAVWLDGRMYPLRSINITVPRQADGELDPTGVWHIRSHRATTPQDHYLGEYHKGCPYEIDLQFTPFPVIPIRQERLHALVISSDFYQPFGEFEGYICVAGAHGEGKPKKLVLDISNIPPAHENKEDDGAIFFDSVKGVVEDHYAKW